MILMPLTDKETILKLLQKENLYRYFYYATDVNDIDLKMNKNKWFIGIENDDVVLLLLITDNSGYTLYFHGGVYKKYRGKDTAKKVKECLELLRQQNKDIIWMTTISKHNRLAQKLVEKMGLKYKATIPKGYKTTDLLIYSEV